MKRWLGRRLFLGLIVPLTGCMTWSPTAGPPLTVVERERPPVIRITDDEGTQTIIRRPNVRDSAIIGQGERRECTLDLDGRNRCHPTTEEVEIDVNAIAQLELRVPHRPGHSALIGAAIAASATMVTVVGTGGGCFRYDAGYCTRLTLIATAVTTLFGAIVGTIAPG
ncbi:MAG: hypothetical protein AAF389_04990 [Gemmatimonadota bacterium]